jgi:RHS repeat-associated protein
MKRGTPCANHPQGNDSFTTMVVTSMTFPATCATAVRFSPSLSTGKERDSESGNDYFGARYYSSGMGRFMSPDPSMESVRMDNPQTWNKYSYVLNNPLELTDPTGETWNLASGAADESSNPTWTDHCGVADQCINTIALTNSDNSISVYGTAGANDVSTYSPNDSGMISLTDLAANPDSQFVISPQKYAENYLDPSAASALYNVSATYHETHPNDEKIGMNGGSTSTGEPAKDATGKPVHQAHHGGEDVDVTYMSSSGKRLHGKTAAANGDAARNKEIISSMSAAGLHRAITGNSTKYGSKPVSERLRAVHDTHMHFQPN